MGFWEKLGDDIDNLEKKNRVNTAGTGSNASYLKPILICALYGFFAFGYSNDPESKWVSNDDDLIKCYYWVDGTDGCGITVDVAHRFHIFFLYAFYYSLFVLCATFYINQIANNNSLAYISQKLMRWGGWVFMFAWILAFIWRFDASGRDACGDFLEWPEDNWDKLAYQGLFFFIIACVIVFFFILGLFK